MAPLTDLARTSPRSRTVTLKDVAARAGVSPATVSRTLNGKNVDPQLAARVHAAVAELGYRANAVARNLRRQDTRVWALVIADLENPFFTALTRGVEDVASDNGYSLLLCNSDEDVDKEHRYLEVVEAERVAGLIIAPLDETTDVSRLVASRIPVVAVDRPLGSGTRPFDLVTSDSRTGARLATLHLLEQGWGRVAMLGGPLNAHTASERALGYEQATLHAGQEPFIVRMPYTIDGGREGTRRLLAADARPDAIVAANAMLGLGCLDVLREHGLVAGRDVGLVAFDESPWANLLTPPLTLVRQDAYGIGSTAATLLVQRLRDGEEHDARSVRYPTTLIERGSSRRP